MPFCAILQCKNNSRTKSLTKGGISFHRFPKDPEIKEKWIDATGRQNWFPTKWSTICSEHFDEKCFLIKKSGYKYLVDTALPIVKVFYFQKSQRQTNVQIEESTIEIVGPSAENVSSPIPHKRKTNIDTFVKSPSPEKLRLETGTCENISSTASTSRKKRLHGMLRWKDDLIKKQNLQIRRLRARNSRLKRKITKIEDILKALEEKSSHCVNGRTS